MSKESVLLSIPGAMARYGNGNAYLIPLGRVQFTPEGIRYRPYSRIFMGLMTKLIYNTNLIPYSQISRIETCQGMFSKNNTLRVIVDRVNASSMLSLGGLLTEALPQLRALLEACAREKSFGPAAQEIADTLGPILKRASAKYRNLIIALLVLACLLWYFVSGLMGVVLAGISIMLAMSANSKPTVAFASIVTIVLFLFLLG